MWWDRTTTRDCACLILPTHTLPNTPIHPYTHTPIHPYIHLLVTRFAQQKSFSGYLWSTEDSHRDLIYHLHNHLLTISNGSIGLITYTQDGTVVSPFYGVYPWQIDDSIRTPSREVLRRCIGPTGECGGRYTTTISACLMCARLVLVSSFPYIPHTPSVTRFARHLFTYRMHRFPQPRNAS